jgi:hypothetical protein
MPKIATVNSNTTSFTVTDGLFKQTYPLVDSSTNLVSNADGSSTLYLLWGDEVVVIISDTVNSPFTGNTIFGAVTPTVAQTAIQAAIGTAGGGGGGGSATSANQITANTSLASILTELQKRTTIQVVQNLTIGSNTIVHNLALLAPFTTTTTIVDNATGTSIIASISSQSDNSLVITSPIAYPNVRITIRS